MVLRGGGVPVSGRLPSTPDGYKGGDVCFWKGKGEKFFFWVPRSDGFKHQEKKRARGAGGFGAWLAKKILKLQK